MPYKNVEFDLLRMGFTVIVIVIGLVTIFLKRDTIKESYKGALYVFFLGLLFFFIVIASIYSLNESATISLIIDFLIFKKISAKGANTYGRAIGYLLLVIGTELFVLTLLRRKKLKSNK